MRCRQTPCPEIGSRHRCMPSIPRVRLPVSLCHIANSKNGREFNAGHNQLWRLKLLTANSHFATLPVRHRASGMYLRSHLQRLNRPLRHFCETYTGHFPMNRRPRKAKARRCPRRPVRPGPPDLAVMLRRDADKDLGVITDGQRLANVTTAHLRTSTQLTAAAASLPSGCDGTPSCHHPGTDRPPLRAYPINPAQR
jgi:hypothetical protein